MMNRAMVQFLILRTLDGENYAAWKAKNEIIYVGTR